VSHVAAFRAVSRHLRRRAPALVAPLLLAPTAAHAQGLLEQFSYEGLRLTGIGIEVGGVASDRLTTGPSVGVRIDYGLIAPSVRVLIGGSHYKGSFGREELGRFEQRLRSVVTDPTNDFTIDIGEVTWRTVQVDLDLQYLFPSRGVTPYLGVGVAVQVHDGTGRAIEGTFVEDALDTVEAGLNVTVGTAVALARSLQLTAEVRGGLTGELRTIAARGGLMVRLPRRGVS